jgi:hypothetical protein
LRRIVLTNHSTTKYRWQQNWIFILKTLFPKESLRRELQKSKIHSRAATVKPLITENNAQMRKRWCHDHKTWASDNWKRARG